MQFYQKNINTVLFCELVNEWVSERAKEQMIERTNERASERKRERKRKGERKRKKMPLFSFASNKWTWNSVMQKKTTSTNSLPFELMNMAGT